MQLPAQRSHLPRDMLQPQKGLAWDFALGLRMLLVRGLELEDILLIGFRV